MAIDKGPTLIQVLLAKKLVKTTSHGYILTQEGAEVIFNAIASLNQVTRQPSIINSALPNNADANRVDGFADQEPE